MGKVMQVKEDTIQEYLSLEYQLTDIEQRLRNSDIILNTTLKERDELMQKAGHINAKMQMIKDKVSIKEDL